MENGTVYWSNWASLSEVTSVMQVQRGIGATKLSAPSVGGTINIITKGIEAKKVEASLSLLAMMVIKEHLFVLVQA